MGGRASLRRGRGRARRDSPQDARRLGGQRRASFRGKRISVDDGDARPDRVLDDHAGTPDLGLAAICAAVELSLGADREIVQPEISPLGRGAVDAYLAVVNATRPPARRSTTRSAWRSIAYGERFRAREFAVHAGAALGAYRVNVEPWVLRVQLARSASETGDSQSGFAALSFADLTVVAMPDRSSVGRALYETIASSGSVFAFELPPGGELVWATVDSDTAVPLRSDSGTYSIALPDRGPSRVGVFWQCGPASSQPAGSTWPVALPKAGRGAATTLVTVTMPPDFVVRGDFAGLESTTMARMEMARADWLARTIGDFVAKIDRSSGRHHEKLVNLLVSHEMALRSADRSEAQSLATAPGAKRARVPGDSELIRAARAARVETTRRAGLDQDLAAAAFYLGTSPANGARPLVGVAESGAPDRIRRLGYPLALIGALPGLDQSASRPSLSLERRPWPDSARYGRGASYLALAVVLGIVVVTTVRRQGVWGQLLGLVLALGLAAATGGPAIVLGGLGLAILGWNTHRH